MSKTYSLKDLRPLLDLTGEDLPLLDSYDPYGDESDPSAVRYIIDKRGVWLRVNKGYGSGGTNRSALSNRELEEITGFCKDDLEPVYVDGVCDRYGLSGGQPILPFPFTAAELLAFDRVTGVILEAIEQTDEWIAELERRNPDSAELAKIVLSGEPLSVESVDHKTEEDALVRAPFKQTGREEAFPVKITSSTRWTPEFLAEVSQYRDVQGTKAAALHFGVSEQLIRRKLPRKRPELGGISAFSPWPK